MKRFYLQRDIDETGVSGTGKIAEGVMFTSGRIALTWLTPFASYAFYDNAEVLQHLHGHNGKTRVVFVDERHG